MALLRPRQFGTNSQNPHSQPSQDSQQGLPSTALPSTMSSPPSLPLGPFPTGPGMSMPTTMHVTASSTQSQSSGSLSTNTPLGVTSSSAHDASATPPASTAAGGSGASASSSAPLSASTTAPGITSSNGAKCTSLSCNPAKAAAVFVPVASVETNTPATLDKIEPAPPAVLFGGEPRA